jgi:hypothetical protein
MRLRLLSALLALVAALPVLAEETEKLNLKKGDRIVFLGDSITQAGVGKKGYVTLIRAHLADKRKGDGIEVVGAGMSGNKVPDLQKRLDRDVLKRKPTVVVISIGIKGWHGSPARHAEGPVRGRAAGRPRPDPGGGGEGGAVYTERHRREDRRGQQERQEAGRVRRHQPKGGEGEEGGPVQPAPGVRGSPEGPQQGRPGEGHPDQRQVHLNEACNKLVAQTVLKALGE